MHKLSLLTTKAYPNFVRIHQFVHDLQSKQTLRPTERQFLNFRVATKLTMAPTRTMVTMVM